MREFCHFVPLVMALWCGTAAITAQSTDSKDLGVGRLLVASRGLSDPNFAKTVILLIQYGESGAVGLAMNRPTKVPISRVLEELKAAKGRSDSVFAGGPVGTEEVFALLGPGAASQEGIRIGENVRLVRTKPALEKAVAANRDPGSLRIYVGYCGWGTGQLEHEVGLGAWHIFKSAADKAFDPDPASLWARMIALTERQFAARRPSPPS